MDHRKKALLLGDYTHPDWHPLQGVDAEISRIFHDTMTVQCSENRNMLLQENITGFDVCISYMDDWKGKVSPQQTAGLLSYVSNGGGLVIIHNGISLQNRYELKQMIGAKFLHHPPYAPLEFTVTAESHPVTEGISGFTMEEEPYQFEFGSFAETKVLLEYQSAEGPKPAAWAHRYGLGRIVYLMPGHHVPSFAHDTYRQLILQAGKWAARYV